MSARFPLSAQTLRANESTRPGLRPGADWGRRVVVTDRRLAQWWLRTAIATGAMPVPDISFAEVGADCRAGILAAALLEGVSGKRRLLDDGAVSV